MGLQANFKEFEEKIRLTWSDEKLKTIREKDTSIQGDIKLAFKDKGYPVLYFFQQGSYATQTCIEPLNEGDDYDIDVGVVISKSTAPDNPVDVKKTLRDVLKDRNLKNPKIKMPCVTAQYYNQGEKRFHLDYPIYSKTDADSFYLAIGKENSGDEIRNWEKGDPKGLIDWLNDRSSFSDEEYYAQYKRLVRYLKRWRDYSFSIADRKKIYSIGLTVMLKRSFKGNISFDGENNDLECLLNTAKAILNDGYFKQVGYDEEYNPQYEICVTLPVEPWRDIFTKHGKTLGTSMYTKFKVLIDNLEKVKLEQSLKKQCKILANDVFGSDFPIPENDISENMRFKEPGFIASPQGA
jgi:hypothetical protein